MMTNYQYFPHLHYLIYSILLALNQSNTIQYVIKWNNIAGYILKHKTLRSFDHDY